MTVVAAASRSPRRDSVTPGHGVLLGCSSIPSRMDEGTILPALCWDRPFFIVKHLVWSLWSGYVPFAWFGLQKGWLQSMWLSRLLPLQLNFPLPLVGEMQTETCLILPCLSQPGLLSLSEQPKITPASCPNVVHARLASHYPHRRVKCTAGVLSLGKKDSSAVSRGFPEARFVCSYWGFSRKDDPKRKPWVVLTASIWVGRVSRPTYHKTLQENICVLDSEGFSFFSSAIDFFLKLPSYFVVLPCGY